MDSIEDRFKRWYPSSDDIHRSLVQFEIPRTSGFTYKSAEMRKTVLISCAATRQVDPEICVKRFWRMTFSIKLIDDDAVPKLHSRRWDDDDETQDLPSAIGMHATGI